MARLDERIDPWTHHTQPLIQKAQVQIYRFAHISKMWDSFLCFLRRKQRKWSNWQVELIPCHATIRFSPNWAESHELVRSFPFKTMLKHSLDLLVNCYMKTVWRKVCLLKLLFFLIGEIDLIDILNYCCRSFGGHCCHESSFWNSKERIWHRVSCKSFEGKDCSSCMHGLVGNDLVPQVPCWFSTGCFLCSLLFA